MTKKSEFNLNGYILGEFDSPIDGKPCVAIATGFKSKSQNASKQKYLYLDLLK